jgi:hypothetical protein
MHAGMHPHMAVTPRPINLASDRLADSWKHRLIGRNMKDPAITFAGIYDGYFLVTKAQHANIARLAAAIWIKDRSIQDNSAAIC